MACGAAVAGIATSVIFRVLFGQFLEFLQQLKAETLDIVNL